MRVNLIVIGLLLLNLECVAQLNAPTTGPSLVNTVDWASTNVVNIADDVNQYRQRLTYDYENQCQCRLKINIINQNGDLQTSNYSFNFGDIDPGSIKYDAANSLVKITLQTYDKGKRVSVFLDEKEERTNTIIIYEKDEENASRLVRAFSHISRLCHQ